MSTLPPVIGYLDRLSAQPGGRITAHVSVERPGACHASLVRVVCADPNPAGPGMDIRPMPEVFSASFDALHQPAPIGSYARVEGAPHFAKHEPRTWGVLVQLLADMPAATVLHAGGIVLRAGAEGAQAEVAGLRLATGAALAPRRWHRLWVSHDPASGRVVLGHSTLGGGSARVEGTTGDAPAEPETVTFAARGSLASIGAMPDPLAVAPAKAGAQLPAAPTRGAVGSRFRGNDREQEPGVALAGTETADHFTGRLEDPLAAASFVEDWPHPLDAPDGIRARWDFSIGIGTDAITDTGPDALHGTLVNAPTRAVVGARWSGAEHCWRHAPADYGALHFHADDLDDCRWQPSFSFDIPDKLPSGAYAFHVTGAGGEDWLPFFVTPPREGPRPAVVVLASTFTWQAYANHARGSSDEAYMARVRDWGAYPLDPDHVTAFGVSTYNRHPDGSGVSLSSRLRPMLTMRPGFLTFNDARGSGLRHYPADTHLLAWLEAKGIPFDIVTDEDLDDEGAAILSGYRVLLTGSHPEYHTPRMLDALTAFRDGGGNLMYLGGNGFYWRIARDPARPHRIEVRRAEGGIRAWDAASGEYHHQLDGALGGLWRRNRRPPQALVGVGFSAQGLFESTHYRRLPASHDPAHAWMFDGVPEIFGETGLSGGGAAGFELDRADVALGTPAEAVVLARSENPPASFVAVPEELLSHIRTVNGEQPDALKRAEIVWFRVPGGGQVFSVGSITFCGSLWDGKAFDGGVSRLLENVLRRFTT